MADGITDSLTAEIGPLPVWAWGIAIAGGLGVGWLIQRSMAESGAEGAGEPSEPGDDLPATQGPIGLPGGPGTAGAGPILPEEQIGGGGPTNNPEWRAAGVDFLIAQGVAGTTADAALGRYLGGQELTAAQAELVDQVLAELGSPPDGAPSPQVGEEPDPDPGPSPGSLPAWAAAFDDAELRAGGTKVRHTHGYGDKWKSHTHGVDDFSTLAQHNAAHTGQVYSDKAAWDDAQSQPAPPEPEPVPQPPKPNPPDAKLASGWEYHWHEFTKEGKDGEWTVRKKNVPSLFYALDAAPDVAFASGDNPFSATPKPGV